MSSVVFHDRPRTFKKTRAQLQSVLRPATIINCKKRTEALVKKRSLIISSNVRQFLKRPTASGNDGTFNKRVKACDDMLKFSYLVGTPENSIVFDRTLNVSNPPPPEPDFVIAFLDYMCQPEGTVLKLGTRDVLHPETNQKVVCTGTWHCVSNVENIQTTIRRLATLHDNLAGLYKEILPCIHCVELNSGVINHQWVSCSTHANNPHLILRRKGDTTTEPRVDQRFKEWKRAMEEGHKRKGNTQLTPSEVCKLRNYLLTKGKEEDVQMYLIILTGIKLFLRIDEVLTLTVEQFISKLFQVDPEGVRTLVVEVCGKSDPHPLRFNIFEDTRDHQFDLVLHLLCYIKCSGIKSGLLFPIFAQMVEKEGSTVVKTNYQKFYSHFGWLLRHVLKKSDACQVGTHTLRKTAYLFAVWGLLQNCGTWSKENKNIPTINDIGLALIMQAARHKHVKHAQLYLKSCCSKYERALNDRFTVRDNTVSNWRSIGPVEEDEEDTEVTPDTILRLPLPELAEWWFTKILGFPERSNCPSFVSLYGLAVTKRIQSYQELSTAETCQKEVIEIFSKHSALSTEEQKNALQNVLLSYKQTCLKENSCFMDNITAEASEHLMPTPGSEKADVCKPPPSKRSRGGQLILHERSAIKAATSTIARVQLILQAYDQYKATVKQLVSPDQAFFYNIQNIAQCVLNCYSGNVTEFSSQHPKLPLSKFKCQCK